MVLGGFTESGLRRVGPTLFEKGRAKGRLKPFSKALCPGLPFKGGGQGVKVLKPSLELPVEPSHRPSLKPPLSPLFRSSMKPPRKRSLKSSRIAPASHSDSCMAAGA